MNLCIHCPSVFLEFLLLQTPLSPSFKPPLPSTKPPLPLCQTPSLPSLSPLSPQNWQIIILRYFNPGGAHPSGLLGESTRSGAPLNLLPRLAEVAAGERGAVHVFGGDWPTPDGTCIRDYMHVLDLAEGHVAAVRKAAGGGGGGGGGGDGGGGGGGGGGGVLTYNLGRGQGVSVLQIIQEFSR